MLRQKPLTMASATLGYTTAHRANVVCSVPGPAHRHCGRPTIASNASSPSQSDEGSLTLQEEAMELEVPPTQGKQVQFREPPSFQARV